MHKLLACLLFIIIVATSTKNSFAADNVQFPQATGGMVNGALMRLVPVRFLPSSPIYFLIWSKEVVSRFFEPSAARRAEFDSVLAGKRIKEAYLLQKKGDVKNSSAVLFRYKTRIESMVVQFDKARSQNQDIAEVIDVAVNNFSQEEVLFSAIAQETKGNVTSYNYEGNFNAAANAFSKSINYLNTLKPGVKNRFKSLTAQNSVPTPIVPSPSPFVESTGSVKPLRIIY